MLSNICMKINILRYATMQLEHTKAHLRASLQERRKRRGTVYQLMLSRQRYFSLPVVFSSSRGFSPFHMCFPHSSLFRPEAHILYYKFWPIPRGRNNHMLWVGFEGFGHTCVTQHMFFICIPKDV